MILLSSQKVEQALAAGKLDAWSKVKFLILPLVLGSLVGPFYIMSPRYGEREPWANGISFLACNLVSAYVTYRGIKRCFRTNQGIDGAAFFERFTVLVVPPMMRVMVTFFVLSLVVDYGGIGWVGDPSSEINAIALITHAFGPVATFSIYAMAERSFRRLERLVGSARAPGP